MVGGFTSSAYGLGCLKKKKNGADLFFFVVYDCFLFPFIVVWCSSPVSGILLFSWWSSFAAALAFSLLPPSEGRLDRRLAVFIALFFGCFLSINSLISSTFGVFLSIYSLLFSCISQIFFVPLYYNNKAV